METIIVHHRSIHHAKNSGYSRVIDYMAKATIITGSSRFPYRFAKIIGDYSNQEAGLYDSQSVLKDIQLYKELKKEKSTQKVVHYLNAERDIRYIVNHKKLFKSAFFCGTFHKPPLILENSIKNNSYLKKIDGTIAVGSNQVEFLKNWLGIENVKYIPHGVDTSFFTPNETKKQANILLFVGQHLRDFEMFNQCIPLIAEKVKGLKVNVVIRKEYIKKIKPHAAINIWSGINDFELRALYQNASLLFLPLKDVTACNSILEAMSCGLTIVTTDVGGNSSYLEGTNNILAPLKNKDILIDATIDLLKNEDKLFDNGNLSRKNSLKYEWGKIAVQIEKFYKLNVQ